MEINSENVTILTGSIVGKPRLRYSKKKRAVLSFLLLTCLDRKDQNGKQIQVKVNCTAWDQLAEQIASLTNLNKKLVIVGETTVEKLNTYYKQYVLVNSVQIVSEEK